jgi:hypothetical protein
LFRRLDAALEGSSPANLRTQLGMQLALHQGDG